MANPDRRQSLVLDAFTFIELLFHTIVREVRSESGSAMLGILGAVGRTLIMVAAFYVIFEFLGARSALIRGDVILFLVSGVVLFFMHNGAISKTLKAGAFAGPMMLHAPMTVTLSILAATLSVLYLNILALGIILVAIHLLGDGLEIYDPAGIMLPFFLAWASGVIIGLIFLLIKPFAPKLVQLISPVYMRANIITSGKMFTANLLPSMVLPLFAWNPLFHTIDQMRGALFVNYVPHNTSITYPIYFVAGGLVLGMMGEFWLRKTVSRSTG